MIKSNHIRRIVRIRQMLRAWRIRAASLSPADVPPGHVAICVGSSCRRFVVRTTHLNHPIFRQLLSQIEEEYGFPNCTGPLVIPCDESRFEEILRLISEGESVNSELSRGCNVGIRNENSDSFAESRPLLYGFSA